MSDTWLAEQAAEAYLAGYLLHGVPLTERASRGCTAAIAAALDNPDDPLVLETTLLIGSLTGAWALVFTRRERLIARHTAKVEALWRTLTASLDIPGMVAAYRQQAGMTAETQRPGWAAALRAEAVAAAAGMLNGVRSGAEYDDLVIALEDALAAGATEGKTAALAVAAEKAGKAGFDWPRAYAHMFEPLTTIEGLPGMADPWVQQIIAGNAGDIGRTIASMGLDGGTAADMVAAVQDMTQGAPIRAVQAMVDYAMSGAMSAGTQALYAAEGVTLLTWISAGDGRVCVSCDSNEGNSPYAPADFPDMPAHVNCRCVTGSVDDLPLSAFTDFLANA